MDLWEQGKFDGLVHDTVAQCDNSNVVQLRDDDKAAQAFNAQVVSGWIRTAV